MTAFLTSSKPSTDPFDALGDIVGLPADNPASVAPAAPSAIPRRAPRASPRASPRGPSVRSPTVDSTIAGRIANVKAHMGASSSTTNKVNPHMPYPSANLYYQQPHNYGITGANISAIANPQPYYMRQQSYHPTYNTHTNNYVTMTTTTTTTTTTSMAFNQSQLVTYPPQHALYHQYPMQPTAMQYNMPYKPAMMYNQAPQNLSVAPAAAKAAVPAMQPVSSGVPSRESFRVQRGTKPLQASDDDKAFGLLVEQLKAQHCVKKA